MKLMFKLYATLSDYLPDEAKKTSTLALDLAEGTTVDNLIERFRLPARLCQIVLIDGVFIPPEERAGRILTEGETLAIWPPIAGG